MSSQEIEDQQQQIKQTKNIASQGRDYGCPCGKTYLSYPALYTHIRTKHNGVAPGVITKPKPERIKQKSKAMIARQNNTKQKTSNYSQQSFNLCEETNKILNGVIVNYDGSFEVSDGQNTCQDMASKFLSELSNLKLSHLKAVKCFLHQLKQLLAIKCGQKYWKTNSPTQLITMVNQLSKFHQQHNNQFQLSKTTFQQLIFLLFKWLYQNKWINDQLIKRNSFLGLQTMIK